ncbi:hypothetical protein OQA88_12151 [Cercophora sp. LCS_1]
MDRRNPPRRKDDRVILHFDLDCFYAQAQNKDPSLKTKPLGIRQKGILATCNYVARKRGVGKLTTLAEAKRLCPDLVIVDGEDLSPFRDVSKRLYALLRSYSWSGKIERLGLDETFLDVTDMVSYNIELLNRNSLAYSYFCLSRTDPEQGFPFDATSFAGCVQGGDNAGAEAALDNPLYMRLLLASHLAYYLRLKIEDEGYTTACGIATNKLLAKLVGNVNKPRNQTTLLSLSDNAVFSFMDSHTLRKVPGIGGKITRILESFVTGREVDPDIYTMECSVTAGQVRTHPPLQIPAVLENLLNTRGSERGLPGKVWALLHGVDDSEVKPAQNIPTQISIEDTYKGLNKLPEICREMSLIATSLLQRMHIDLLEEPQTQGPKKWLAYPKTIRLTTRPYTSPTEGKPYNWARASKSTPLPGFVFNLSMASEQIVEKLVTEILMPLFTGLNPAPRGWNTGLINICVTNMAEVGGGARDIGDMFRRQDGALKEFTVYDETPVQREVKFTGTVEVTQQESDDTDMGEEGDEWDQHDDDGKVGEDMEICSLCGHSLPRFAISAHQRFHRMQMDSD